MLKVTKFIKDFLLFFPITLIFKPLEKIFLFISYFNKLIIWILKNKKNLKFNDFYSPVRDYNKRFKLYDFIINYFNLKNEKINYLEFGVAGGTSFNWWLQNNENIDSKFYGFDTFEGLPENWGGFYEKGAMSFDIPNIKDVKRAAFIKGLFQNTLNNFIENNNELLKSNTRKIIHMDADLYSATIFTLSQLFSFLKKGDIILFDEFSVALHEFKAYHEFVNNFYIKLLPIASVNNFYQTAFVVE